jgi:hypothetical protein
MKRQSNKIDDNIKIDVVSPDQMTDEQRKAVFERESSVDAIPDLDVLTGHVYEILQYLEKPNVSKLLKTNESAIKMHLNSKYADTVPLGIITILMDENNKIENVERLLRMFGQLRKAKAGEISLDDAERILTDEVNERYLYREYGSKAAFEAALMQEVQKEQKKKKLSNVESLKDVGKIRIKK